MPLVIIFSAIAAAASVATLIIAKSGVDQLNNGLTKAEESLVEVQMQYDRTRDAIRNSLI